MTSIQVADDTFVAADPEIAAAVVGDRGRWRRWWPDLRLQVVEDRAAVGVRWRVTGAVTGTMEIWNEAVLDGFVLHYFLHAEPAETGAVVDVVEENRRRRVVGKLMAFEVKDLCEGAREAGGPARSVSDDPAMGVGA